MSSNGHRRDCPDCVPCGDPECGDVAYCTSEWPVLRPCPHNEPYCPDHNVENCIDCRLEAEQEMYRTGEYSRRADPFIDHLAPPAPDRIAENGGYYWEGAWVPVPPKAS